LAVTPDRRDRRRRDRRRFADSGRLPARDRRRREVRRELRRLRRRLAVTLDRRDRRRELRLLFAVTRRRELRRRLAVTLVRRLRRRFEPRRLLRRFRFAVVFPRDESFTPAALSSSLTDRRRRRRGFERIALRRAPML
jgi:hypothetical protein